ncbi:MAG: tripartite tricarboxylate transporter substrate-binding protein [Pseudomonadota bacterium]
MIIDQGPGGQNDVMVRSLSRAAEKELKQPVVCENKPGGGGVISKNYILKSKPDGYTIGVQSISANDSQPHMQKLPYDVLADQVDIAAYLRYAQCI